MRRLAAALLARALRFLTPFASSRLFAAWLLRCVSAWSPGFDLCCSSPQFSSSQFSAPASAPALERTARVTTCPYKGEANYYSITDGKARDDNAVWTYELPRAEVAEIGSHLAFYPDKVEIKRDK